MDHLSKGKNKICNLQYRPKVKVSNILIMSTVSLLGLRMSSINAEQLQISDACQK